MTAGGTAAPRDPRLPPAAVRHAGVKPVVALPRAGLSTMAIVGLVVAAGLFLFLILDARRRTATMPAVLPRAGEVQIGVGPPPPLSVPAAPPPVVAVYAPPPPKPVEPEPVPPRVVYVPQPRVPLLPQIPVIEQPRPVANGPALVVDNSLSAPSVGGSDTARADTASAMVGAAAGRAQAGMFANRATTVAQGTVIQAVLETALDSTRPGFARAIVSRDVRGFDGSRILIPRGSRLIGEYRSEVAPGQRRALVNWSRLIRPDGVTIAIGSPAADPLGRGGVRASVDTHFFERFTGAILQSALNVGVALAARSSSNGTVLVLPGTLQGATQTIQPSQITNTLTVRQGTSISIFAARDLDFTGVEQAR